MSSIEVAASNSKPTRLRVESLEIRRNSAKGEALSFKPSRITAFIGPNNGGKTRTLKEGRSEFTGEDYNKNNIFIEKCDVSGILSDEVESRAEIISINGIEIDDINRKIFSIPNRSEKRSIVVSDLKDYIENQNSEYVYKRVRDSLYKYFVLDLNGSNRLSILDESLSQDIKLPPRSLAAKFFNDRVLSDKISQLCFESFGFYFLVDPTDLGKFRFVGSIEKPEEKFKKSLESDAVDFLRNAFL